LALLLGMQTYLAGRVFFILRKDGKIAVSRTENAKPP
jgi:hypothetical protein